MPVDTKRPISRCRRRLRVVVYARRLTTPTLSTPRLDHYAAIGSVPGAAATAGFAAAISRNARRLHRTLRPVEIEGYRPFFFSAMYRSARAISVLPHDGGSAVAIAGGFRRGARRDRSQFTHTDCVGTARFVVPPASRSSGDTVLVRALFERVYASAYTYAMRTGTDFARKRYVRVTHFHRSSSRSGLFLEHDREQMPRV